MVLVLCACRGVEERLEPEVLLSLNSRKGTSGSVRPWRETVLSDFLLSMCFGTLGNALASLMLGSSFEVFVFGTVGRARDGFTVLNGFIE